MSGVLLSKKVQYFALAQLCLYDIVCMQFLDKLGEILNKALPLQSVKILVILNPIGYKLTSSSFVIFISNISQIGFKNNRQFSCIVQPQTLDFDKNLEGIWCISQIQSFHPMIGEIFRHNWLRSQCLQIQPVPWLHHPVFLY